MELLLLYIRRENIEYDGEKNSQRKCVENNVANNGKNGVMVISPNKTVDTMLETRKKKINVES